MGGAGARIDPPPWLLGSLALGVQIYRNFQLNGAKWRIGLWMTHSGVLTTIKTFYDHECLSVIAPVQLLNNKCEDVLS